MFGLGGIKQHAARLFGYDAVESNNKRKPPIARRRSEDLELNPTQRILLSNASKDLQRNFAIAAWAIRMHLDYITNFTFQADTGDDAFDDDLEEFIRWYSLPANFDAAGRLSRQRFVRMGESRRVLDGDVFLNFLSDGRLQGIEGDRVIDPKNSIAAALGKDPTVQRYVHGVLINNFGRSLAYAVHRRMFNGGEGLQFDTLLSAAFCYHHGYFDRFDQVRGISPLSTACNPLRDVYENFDYALAKSKVSQLFALAFYRKKSEALGTVSEVTAELTDDDDDGDTESDGPRYEVNFGGGPQMVDLDDDDDVKVIESNTPSGEFQSFQNLSIAVALKALDIPFSFYDESHTNYNGQRQAWIRYDESAETKRDDNRAFLNWTTVRRISLAIRDGDLVLPRGMSLRHVIAHCQYISRGIPWIDPLKEITADVAAIKAGQLGPETSCRQRGLDVYKMIDERARVEKYAREHPDGPVILEYDVASLAKANAAAAANDAADAADQPPAKPEKKTPARIKPRPRD